MIVLVMTLIKINISRIREKIMIKYNIEFKLHDTADGKRQIQVQNFSK